MALGQLGRTTDDRMGNKTTPKECLQEASRFYRTNWPTGKTNGPLKWRVYGMEGLYYSL